MNYKYSALCTLPLIIIKEVASNKLQIQQEILMANIKEKDLNNLSSWNLKELRKLRININNRISALSSGSKKDLSASHILNGMDEEQLNQLLAEVKRAEKSLCK